MNRPERPDLMLATRPPRRRRLWLWMTIVVISGLALFGAILYFPFYAFKAKGIRRSAACDGGHGDRAF